MKPQSKRAVTSKFQRRGRFCLSLIAALMLCAAGVQVSAVELDLTSFASGSSETHSHIWEHKHDKTEHWQECSLCSAIQGCAAHNLLTSFTVSETSCSPENKKLVSCSGCSYQESIPWQQPHLADGPGGAWWEAPGNDGLRDHKFCTACCTYSSATSVWTDVNGNCVDPTQVSVPCTLYSEWGTELNLTSKLLSIQNSYPCDVSVTWVSNNQIYVNFYSDLSECLSPYYTAEEAKALCTGCTVYFKYIAANNPHAFGGPATDPARMVMHDNYVFEYTTEVFEVKDPNSDWDLTGRVFWQVFFRKNGEDRVFTTDGVDVLTNHADPTITSTGVD